MRVLLTPDIASLTGTVLFRPGRNLLALFREPQLLISTVPECLKGLPSGLIPDGDFPSEAELAVEPVVTLQADPDSPEAFMLRPKRHRWENTHYTRWVKHQTCLGCNKPADDPHHITGHGLGGTATRSHDLFVIPLCRQCHDSLHANTPAFEAQNGTQLELLFRFLDRVMAIGVIKAAGK